MDRTVVLEQLKRYKQTYADRYTIEALGIFGSVARHEATEESDIDVCIRTQKPDMFMLVHIKEDLQELFQKNVDIVRIRARMNPYLKRRIEQDAIYV